jgi:hypothetical protein
MNRGQREISSLRSRASIWATRGQMLSVSCVAWLKCKSCLRPQSEERLLCDRSRTGYAVPCAGRIDLGRSPKLRAGSRRSPHFCGWRRTRVQQTFDARIYTVVEPSLAAATTAHIGISLLFQISLSGIGFTERTKNSCYARVLINERAQFFLAVARAWTERTGSKNEIFCEGKTEAIAIDATPRAPISSTSRRCTRQPRRSA